MKNSRKFPLSNGKEAIVDARDYDFLWEFGGRKPWHQSEEGFPYCDVNLVAGKKARVVRQYMALAVIIRHEL